MLTVCVLVRLVGTDIITEVGEVVTVEKTTECRGRELAGTGDGTGDGMVRSAID